MRVSLSKGIRTLALESWMSVASWLNLPLCLAKAHSFAWNRVCSGGTMPGPLFFFSQTEGKKTKFSPHIPLYLPLSLPCDIFKLVSCKAGVSHGDRSDYLVFIFCKRAGCPKSRFSLLFNKSKRSFFCHVVIVTKPRGERTAGVIQHLFPHNYM